MKDNEVRIRKEKNASPVNQRLVFIARYTQGYFIGGMVSSQSGFGGSSFSTSQLRSMLENSKRYHPEWFEKAFILKGKSKKNKNVFRLSPAFYDFFGVGRGHVRAEKCERDALHSILWAAYLSSNRLRQMMTISPFERDEQTICLDPFGEESRDGEYDFVITIPSRENVVRGWGATPIVLREANRGFGKGICQELAFQFDSFTAGEIDTSDYLFHELALIPHGFIPKNAVGLHKIKLYYPGLSTPVDGEEKLQIDFKIKKGIMVAPREYMKGVVDFKGFELSENDIVEGGYFPTTQKGFHQKSEKYDGLSRELTQVEKNNVDWEIIKSGKRPKKGYKFGVKY